MSSSHFHTRSIPGGETNYWVSQIFLLNSTRISLKQDTDVLNLVSFRADTAHVSAIKGEKTGPQILSLLPATQISCRHNSGPVLSLPCCAWKPGQAFSTSSSLRIIAPSPHWSAGLHPLLQPSWAGDAEELSAGPPVSENITQWDWSMHPCSALMLTVLSLMQMQPCHCGHFFS